MSGKTLLARTGSVRQALFLPLFIILGLAASSCGPSLTPSPQPTPRVLPLQVTASLLALQPYFQECVIEQENLALAVIQSPSAALDPGQEGVALRWGLSAAPDAQAYELGQEDLVLITHPQNPIREINLNDLRDVYSGALSHWPGSPEGGAIQPWIYPSSEDTQEIFVDALLQGIPPAQSVVYTAPDPLAMIEAVGENPAALGFLPRRWLSAQVKEIAVPGLEPGSLRRPVIALTAPELDASTKGWLGCLQGKLVE